VKLLRGFALAGDEALLERVAEVAARAPFRYLTTPGGHRMSVAMTNCGTLGWVSDRRGYRYDAIDPESGRPWPPMPEELLLLAESAALHAGFEGFAPQVCLINRYRPGARLSLHQDCGDFGSPIVSVSLGVGAVFLLGGVKRADKAERIPLEHGDVVVLGGDARMRYHGVLPLKDGHHPLLGNQRINLTFRKALRAAG
jgi:alkylated DNA repair protein (DNA oxidative demethylase)